jgi:RNA polymerase sigma factor (sigma-70 family)
MDDRRRRFEAQVLPHLDAAYRLGRWLARSREGVEDVVQDAVLRAYRGFDALRNPDAKAWFLAIVRNCHFSARRNPARFWETLPETELAHEVLERGEFHDPAADPERSAMQGEQAQALRALLETLPEEFREVLVLKEFEDLSYRQIAAVTGAPLGTVMSRLSRARASLRKGWLEQMGEIRAVP